MERRTLLLQTMGFTQWRLVRPQVLQGVVQTTVENSVRFIVVSDENIMQDRLFADILLALELAKDAVLNVTFEQLQHLTLPQATQFWLLTTDKQEQEKILPYCQMAEKIYYSPQWHEFKQNQQAKKSFWQQIQQLPQ